MPLQRYLVLNFLTPPLTKKNVVILLKKFINLWGFNNQYDSAGNNFSSFAGHMSFQIFLLVGHLTNWTGHNLLTDNTLKKRTQDVLVRCSVIVSDHYVKLAGHFQNLVGQCPMSDCYFQHWYDGSKHTAKTTVSKVEIVYKIFFWLCTVNLCLQTVVILSVENL